MDDDKAYERLANAIVLCACNDWRRSARRILKNKGRRSDYDTLNECTQFFRGDLIKTLTNVDGNYILDQLKKELSDEVGNKQHNSIVGV